MFDKFETYKPPHLRRMLQCNRCDRSSIHVYRAGVQGRWSAADGMIDGGNEYCIYQCGGCDAVIFVADSWSSEDIDYDDDGETDVAVTTRQYPPIFSKITDADIDYCPDDIARIIREAASSLDNNNLIAATVLAGLTIERICQNLLVKGGNLFQKINSLASELGVDSAQVELLQEIRTRRNVGAHEAAPMSAAEVKAAFEVISIIIDSRYAAPARAANAVRSAKRHLKKKGAHSD